MTTQPTTAPEAGKAQPEKPTRTQDGLANLRDKVTGGKKSGEMVREFFEDYKDLSPGERKQRAIALPIALAFNYLLSEDEKKEEAKKEPQKAQQQSAKSKPTAAPKKAETKDSEEEAEPEEEQEEQEEVLTESEKRKQTSCTDRRLSLINCDPAGSRAPANLKANPTYLLKHGVPAHYENFEQEMIAYLAPGISDRTKGLEKAISILRASPMGKYQCMPQYLFPYVEKFKHLNWKKEGQNEEKLHAVWEFLQSEDLQREAVRGYVTDLKTHDPLYIAVGYYAGADDIPKLRKYLANQSNAKEQESMEKKQGIYTSKLNYAQSVANRYQKLVAAKNLARKAAGQPPDNSFDMELMVDAIGWKESNSFEGNTKPRDEAWENSKRYKQAYGETAIGSLEQVPKINVDEFQKGNLMDALAKHCPYAKIESGPKTMSHHSVTIKGIPGWPKGRKTEGWDHAEAGNTDALIAQGKYKVSTIDRPKNRKTVPKGTHQKLEQMAIALQHDTRMPLFTGIDMVVDGIPVTLVKEIHCNPNTQSKTLGQPHIGTAYFVRS